MCNFFYTVRIYTCTLPIALQALIIPYISYMCSYLLFVRTLQYICTRQHPHRLDTRHHVVAFALSYYILCKSCNIRIYYSDIFLTPFHTCRVF